MSDPYNNNQNQYQQQPPPQPSYDYPNGGGYQAPPPQSHQVPYLPRSSNPYDANDGNGGGNAATMMTTAAVGPYGPPYQGGFQHGQLYGEGDPQQQGMTGGYDRPGGDQSQGYPPMDPVPRQG